MSEGFLGRWSRLKQAQEEVTEVAEISEVLPQEVVESETGVDLAGPQTGSEEESVDTELADPVVLTDIDMPDLATINATSDMSMFLSSGVSVELRRQALRKFFHQPEFNVRDPLDDYALDYSNPDKLVLKVGEKVRGWAEKQMEDAMQQARDSLVELNPDAQEVVEDESVDAIGSDRIEKNTQEETK
jgi:hypothetical protein